MSGSASSRNHCREARERAEEPEDILQSASPMRVGRALCTEFIHIFSLQTASGFCNLAAWKRKTKPLFPSVAVVGKQLPSAAPTTSARFKPCVKNARAEGRQEKLNMPRDIAICTKGYCLYHGSRTHWIVDSDTPVPAEFAVSIGGEIPNFCPFCGSPVIRLCLNCHRQISLSDLWSDFCLKCGERFRSDSGEPLTFLLQTSFVN
jgi:hypothetical protein